MSVSCAVKDGGSSDKKKDLNMMTKEELSILKKLKCVQMKEHAKHPLDINQRLFILILMLAYYRNMNRGAGGLPVGVT